MPTLTVSVIIAAGGAGRRFAAAAGCSTNLTKVFVPLAGRPVLAHTLERFAAVESVIEVIVAAPAACLAEARERFGQTVGSGRPLLFVAGGDDRVESVARALAATNSKADLVAIHDAVRPLIRPAVIRDAFRLAAEHGGAVVGRPVDHTVKRVADGQRIVETVPRDRLWIAQTPQVFRRELILRAYAERDRADPAVTDDAQLVEALGHEVVMVQGDAANLKITTPEDLRLCEALLAAGWPFM
jgi:2-C-methyl-D-erythritol 4-phosphate cytidylyltransferase